jgi:hypothetical protein
LRNPISLKQLWIVYSDDKIKWLISS